MTDDASVGSLIIDAQNTILVIGSDSDVVRLVVGKNTQAICYESDCSAESITVPDGYVADSVDPTVLVDPSSGEEVDADAYVFIPIPSVFGVIESRPRSNSFLNAKIN